MKILFQNRPDLFKEPGGDTIQLVKTKEYLEKLGVNVDISTKLTPNVKDYDIVHLFNITRIKETYYQAVNAKKQNKPVVLSTIYWNKNECFRKAAMYSSIVDKLKQPPKYAFKQALNIAEHYQIKKVLQMVDMLLPNAVGEAQLVIKDFGIKREFHVVPNAVDENMCSEFLKVPAEKEGIILVGRIEPRKNQIGLIKALNDNPQIPLIFVGSYYNERYYFQCKELAEKRGNVKFIPHGNFDKLRELYISSKVHALPSWYDTPGLVSLEAALFDCNIVTTDRGTAKEYFGDKAWYCSPDDLDSIKTACLEAYNSSIKEGLKDHILNNYTWEKAALETKAAYEKVLRDIL